MFLHSNYLGKSLGKDGGRGTEQVYMKRECIIDVNHVRESSRATLLKVSFLNAGHGGPLLIWHICKMRIPNVWYINFH